MHFVTPTRALCAITAAALSTVLLTAAATAPGSTVSDAAWAAEATASASPAALSDPAPAGDEAAGERFAQARANLEALVAEVEAATEGNAETSERISEARTALDERLVDAARLAPSAETFAAAPEAYLIDAESEHVARLEAETEALRRGFEAWQLAVDEARTAREQAAEQARFEAQQAASAATPNLTESVAGPPAYSVPTSTAGAYSISPIGSGGQGLIDACAGPVWWTPTIYPYLAEHWHCGGSAFPRYAGALVSVAGSGMYQTVGVVAQVNAYQQDMLAVPAGYDLYYQTCLNNDPSTTVVVGLMRVG